MRIEAHLLSWNEITLMPFVLKHYQKFCDKIVIHDNHSTDGSAELAKAMGCEVIQFGTKFFDDQENQKIKNTCWRGSDADWVIVADFDEVLMIRNCMLDYFYQPDTIKFWFEDLGNHFDSKKDCTIFKTIGWQVMSDRMPENDLLEVANGYRFDNYSKSIVFKPKELTATNFNLGAHKCNPEGNVKWSSEGNVYVLHYKHIGGLQRTIDRYSEYKKRMSPFNRKHGHGKHYNRTPASLKQEWEERIKISKPLI